MMINKLLSGFLAIAVVLGVVAVPAFAVNNSAPKSTGGVVAEAGGVTFNLSFNAQDHKNGVKGNVVYSNSTGAEFKGTVNECYNQVGNEASFAGEVKDGTFTEQYFQVEVQDNGQGDGANPDRVRVRLANAPFTCDISGAFPGEVTDGNLVVHE